GGLGGTADAVATRQLALYSRASIRQRSANQEVLEIFRVCLVPSHHFWAASVLLRCAWLPGSQLTQGGHREDQSYIPQGGQLRFGEPAPAKSLRRRYPQQACQPTCSNAREQSRRCRLEILL